MSVSTNAMKRFHETFIRDRQWYWDREYSRWAKNRDQSDN